MLLLIRKIIIISFILFSQISLVFAAKIAIIVPMEHQAMEQIVFGITESLKNIDIEIVVKNAHGDSNIMASLIKQMRDDDDIKIIMPIGTSTSQMVLAHVKNKAIVCVAAKIEKLSNPLATGLNDEIPISASIQKFKILRKIAVIYSASEKIAPEIEELKIYAKNNGVALHLSMIQNLTDLPAVVASAPVDVDSFLILKDHLVVSGVNIIIKEASKRAIPLIASDEGSVNSGASIAIGVPEKQIGFDAGLITLDILNGKNPSKIPYKSIEKMVIFVNPKSFAKQKVLTREMLENAGMTIMDTPSTLGKVSE